MPKKSGKPKNVAKSIKDKLGALKRRGGKKAGVVTSARPTNPQTKTGAKTSRRLPGRTARSGSRTPVGGDIELATAGASSRRVEIKNRKSPNYHMVDSAWRPAQMENGKMRLPGYLGGTTKHEYINLRKKSNTGRTRKTKKK